MINKNLKISLAAIGYLLLCYTLLRLGFFIANHNFFTDAGAKDIALAFIYGLRFDLAAVLMLNGVLLLLYNLPMKFTNSKWFKIVLLILFWGINFIFITINLADYGYFPVTQRRLTSELYIMLGDILRMLPSMLPDYWHLFLALALAGALFIYASWRLFRRLDSRFVYKLKFWRELACWLLLAFLMWPGVKGGFQRKPIRPAHAFFSSHRSIGYLTLNSSFTVFISLFQARLSQIKIMPESEAVKEVTAMLYQHDEQMIDPRYPFLRRKTVSASPRRMNVVIFIMESFTADYVGCISGRESATPFFDSLAASGTLFTNFIATGHRSVIAVPSILDSIPGFYTTSEIGKANSFIESQSEADSYIGLGNILLQQGYTTSFHHGGGRGALGFDAHTRMSGFLNYFCEDEYKQSADTAAAIDTVWGVWDEEFFQDAIKRMDAFNKPFCSAIFSLSSHEPFNLPKHREALFQSYTHDNKLARALRYADFSLQEFFRVAQTKPWYHDTIFVITADHTTHSEANNLYSSYHIPLLIYAPPRQGGNGTRAEALAPTIMKPSRQDGVGSQVDILPTILDLLRIPAVHSSMGTSLMEPQHPHYAIVSDGARYAVFADQFVLISDLEERADLYDYHNDKLFKDNLSDKYPDTTQKLKRVLAAYIQEVTGAIAHNKICRDSDLK